MEKKARLMAARFRNRVWPCPTPIWLGVERNWSTIPTAADYYQIPIPKFSVTPVLCVSVVIQSSVPSLPPSALSPTGIVPGTRAGWILPLGGKGE